MVHNSTATAINSTILKFGSQVQPNLAPKKMSDSWPKQTHFDPTINFSFIFLARISDCLLCFLLFIRVEQETKQHPTQQYRALSHWNLKLSKFKYIDWASEWFLENSMKTCMYRTEQRCYSNWFKSRKIEF